jgi:hypothetical protein
MSEQSIAIVDRPVYKDRRGSRATALTLALKDTLTNGKAVSVPLNGETYAVVRNRRAGGISTMAKRLGAALRTQPSADGAALLLWLEPKTGTRQEDALTHD